MNLENGMDWETVKRHTSVEVAMITIQQAYLPYEQHALIYHHKHKES